MLFSIGFSKTYYYVHDHLYSPVAIADPNNGAAIERYEYDAYGRCCVLDPDFSIDADGLSDYDNPYLFTGRRWDILNNGSLKIQYSRNRYYDHHTGRFLTHDPLGITPNPQSLNFFDITSQYTDGLNLYEYVSSNPVINVDTHGLLAPPISRIDLRSVCDNYSCFDCFKVDVKYGDEEKEQCYSEADKLSSEYQQLIRNYWVTGPSYTGCNEYQSLIRSHFDFIKPLSFFILKNGSNITVSITDDWTWYMNFVGVFHPCNKQKVEYDPGRYRYEPGKTSDAALDPWDLGLWPIPYNKGFGNPYVQPGRGSEMGWF